MAEGSEDFDQKSQKGKSENSDASEKSSSFSRWVCGINDAWQGEKSSSPPGSDTGGSGEGGSASGSQEKAPGTTETGPSSSGHPGAGSSLDGQRPSSDSDRSGGEAGDAGSAGGAGGALLRDHRNGVCNPCVYNNSLLGCRKGSACGFCHYEHGQRPTAGLLRPPKRNRDKMKQRVEACFEVPEDELHWTLQAEALRHPYARGLIHNFLDQMASETSSAAPLDPGQQAYSSQV